VDDMTDVACMLGEIEIEIPSPQVNHRLSRKESIYYFGRLLK
jgi:hypothetical protein